MKRRTVTVAVLALALAFLLAVSGSALAVPGKNKDGQHRDPDKVNARAAAALQKGKKPKDMANVLTILVEFGGAGPLHNQMPQPTAPDNTTYWIPDFSTQHYNDMLFSKTGASMYTYFMEQSGSLFGVTGQAYGWYQVGQPESFYGANDANGDDINPWQLIRDAVTAAGDSIPWAEYDQEDPYDLDGDGITMEPDHFIDHVQFVHAGADEAAGGGAQGSDAIWSHSWWAYIGGDNPLYPGMGLGGVKCGSSDIYVGPYTINPEDGTIGVFCHEFIHDLGIPDVYDTIYSGEESAEGWTIMSYGSWWGAPGQPVGTSPCAMSIWEKYALGWVDPIVIEPGDPVRKINLRAVEQPGNNSEAIRVSLPPYEYTTTVQPPYAGSWEWYSGKGDNFNYSITHQLSLAPGVPAQLSFWTWYDIEAGYDYAYVESSDDGVSWAILPGNLTVDDGNGHQALSGSSTGWQQATYSFTPYTAAPFIRLRYYTDGGVQGAGWLWDELSVTQSGVVVFADDAETDTGWTANAGSTWQRTTGTITQMATHYYLLEWREPIGFDVCMNSWYNWISSAAGYAEFYKATPGMLVWYRTTEFGDNHVGVHPWQGYLLLVDSKYNWIPAYGTESITKKLFKLKNTPMPVRTRINLADAAFGVGATIPVSLTSWFGYPARITLAQRAQTATFDDTKSWVDRTWEPYFPLDTSGYLFYSMNSVATPSYGVKATVTATLAKNGGGSVKVDFSSPLANPILP
jgi:immune inhibitor A